MWKLRAWVSCPDLSSEVAAVATHGVHGTKVPTLGR